MAKRRVAQVMGETNRGDDSLNIGLAFFNVIAQFLNSPASNGTSYTGHFQTVCQSVVHHLASRQGKHLGFIL